MCMWGVPCAMKNDIVVGLAADPRVEQPNIKLQECFSVTPSEYLTLHHSQRRGEEMWDFSMRPVCKSPLSLAAFCCFGRTKVGPIRRLWAGNSPVCRFFSSVYLQAVAKLLALQLHWLECNRRFLSNTVVSVQHRHLGIKLPHVIFRSE